MASATKNLKAIATVTIAPVERWCDAAREGAQSAPAFARVAGQRVQIYVDSMREASVVHLSGGAQCGFKEWLLVQESADRLDELAECPQHLRGVPTWICQSLLEMD